MGAGTFTLCGQANVSGTCMDGYKWNVARLPSGNAAVYVNAAARTQLLASKNPDIPDDWAVFAAYPSRALSPPPSKSVTTWSRQLLCQTGRYYRAYSSSLTPSISDCCAVTGTGCVCSQRSRDFFKCIFGCPCKKYDCRTQCTATSTTSSRPGGGVYVSGYPGSTGGGGVVFEGCQKYDSTTQYQSTIVESAASVAACVTASSGAGFLKTKGYACPGMSGSGLSRLGACRFSVDLFLFF